MQTILRGAKFRPMGAQLALLKLTAGDAVTLRPEPTNQYDPNAIQVLCTDDEGEHFIGYVAKEDCEDVLGMLNVGPVRASILEENGQSPSLSIEQDWDAIEQASAAGDGAE